jgi:uncharacterized protein YbcV (DUF1398 family)
MKSLLIVLLAVIFVSCTKVKKPETDFDRYCQFATKASKGDFYKKNPVEHLKLYSEFKKKGISKNLNYILSVIQKVKKNSRAEIFIRAVNKVQKRTDWKCDGYKNYINKFVSARPAIKK